MKGCVDIIGGHCEEPSGDEAISKHRDCYSREGGDWNAKTLETVDATTEGGKER